MPGCGAFGLPDDQQKKPGSPGERLDRYGWKKSKVLSDGSGNSLNPGSHPIRCYVAPMLLLWDVDTQVDFLTPSGRLYVRGSEKIIPNLRLLTSWGGKHHVLVISSACAHQPGDPELETFGEHCMAGTAGQQKVPETLLPNNFVVPKWPIQLPDLRSFQQIILEKQEFHFFSNANHRQVLQQFGNSFDILLYGVATDICVAAAARYLLTQGHKVSLIRDATADLDPKKTSRFLAEFRRRGGELLTVNQVMAIQPGIVGRSYSKKYH